MSSEDRFLSSGWLEGTDEVRGTYVEDVLAEKGLDWTTRLYRTAYYDEETVSLAGQPLFQRRIPNSFANVRETDGETLGVVGRRYTPIQNREAFGVLNVLIQADEMLIERVQSIRDGRKVMIVARKPGEFQIAGEPYSRYSAWVNSHDGQSPVLMVPVPSRNFCQNVLRFRTGSRNDAYKIRHTRYAPARLIAAQQEQFGIDSIDIELDDILNKELMHDGRQALGLQAEYEAKMVRTGDELAKIKITDREFEKFLASLVPVPAEERDTEGRVVNQRGITLNTNRREDIRAIYKGEANLNNIRGTAWGAVQSVVQWNDHVRNYQTPDRKIEAILEGADLNQKALALLN